MADAAYDAIIIGGGTHGLIVANYLVKYGRMKVAIFEARPELGGGLGCEETVGSVNFLIEYGFLTREKVPTLKELHGR